MKKISVIAVIGAFAGGAAFAEFVPAAPNGQGGFINDAETIVTVRQVEALRDDVPVIIQGKIIQRMGDEKYLFEDGTGSIVVEIDDDDWAGQTVSPANTVKLYGEVDAGLFKSEVDVDRITVLN